MILTITSDPGASIARKGFTLICARRHFRERYKIHRERRERRGPPPYLPQPPDAAHAGGPTSPMPRMFGFGGFPAFGGGAAYRPPR